VDVQASDDRGSLHGKSQAYRHRAGHGV
jgi:hypothetical protein